MLFLYIFQESAPPRLSNLVPTFFMGVLSPFYLIPGFSGVFGAHERCCTTVQAEQESSRAHSGGPHAVYKEPRARGQ